jgi:hypothetical protein
MLFAWAFPVLSPSIASNDHRERGTMMGLLGTYLEAVYRPGEPFRTLAAQIEAEKRGEGDRKPAVIGKRRSKTGEKSDVQSRRLSVWMEPPIHYRADSVRIIAGQTRCESKIVGGGETWTRVGQGHVNVREGQDYDSPRMSPLAIDSDRHFHLPQIREFFAHMTLEEVGPVTQVGRSCVRFVGRSNDERGIWPHWLPFGADEWIFDGDLERGLLLGIEGRSGGIVFETIQVKQIVLDEEIAPEIFSQEARGGEQVDSASLRPERLSFREAVDRAGFAILIPAGFRADGRAGATWFPARFSGRSSQLVFWDGRSADKCEICLSQHPRPNHDEYEWESISTAPDSPVSDLRISDPGPGENRVRLVAFEQWGTHVTVTSEMPREPLLAYCRLFEALGTGS